MLRNRMAVAAKQVIPSLASRLDNEAEDGRLVIMPPLARTFMARVVLDGNVLGTLQWLVHEHFGFADFSWAFTPVARALPEAPLYGLRLTNTAWGRQYIENRYDLIDTRLKRALRLRLPIAWDQRGERGRSRAMDVLLDAALAHGVGSGVMFPVAELGHNGVVVAFTDGQQVMSARRRTTIEGHLPEMIAFARYFTDALMRPVIDELSTPPRAHSPLTRREREALAGVARGRSGKQIARDLQIAERTVQLHLDNAKEKLGAANRLESVARAVRESLIVNNASASRKA